MSACVPPADYNPGRPGEVSAAQQKSHGAFMLHGFDWFGDLWGGDAGGCGQLLLDLPGLERTPAPPTFPGCAGNPGPYPSAGHARGVPAKPPPPNKKAMGLSCSMALIGLGIYLVAMRAAPAGPSWVGKSPRSVLLPGCAGNPGLCPACGSCTGRSGETSPTQQKSHGALCSMALIDFRIYSMAMRVDAGSSCWAFLGTVMLRTPDSYLHLISSGRRSPT